MSQIKFTIITLFPEALQPYLDSSMLYKAQERGIIAIEYVNLRDFGLGPHKSVDDTPYGGGDGMLLRCEPVFAAIESIKEKSPRAEVILPTPVGKLWNQQLAREFAGISAAGDAFSVDNLTTSITQKPSQSPSEAAYGNFSANSATSAVCGPNAVESLSEPQKHYIILCPHYEGYDERIMTIVDHPICLGPYVLTGGELPALVIIDSITRLLPGVLGGHTSAQIESFSDGDNLEFPQYTKPADFRGLKVPEILLSGDHGKIAAWRRQNSSRQHPSR